MVTQHYRWDFIGLSSYDKPTPDTSEKVVDGSTYYEADTSKLYVFYKDTWYEKTATGGGGGGDITVVQTTGESTTDVMSQKAVTDALAEAGGVKTLTSADFNWNLDLNSATEPYNCVALWLLEPGIYQKTVASGLPVAVHANPGGIETLAMGTYIVATQSVNPDTKQILYTTVNSSRNWYQQLINVSNGTSDGSRQFIMDNNVVQTTGTSNTNVMSQKATTSMVYQEAGGNIYGSINLRGESGSDPSSGTYSIAIGPATIARGNNSIAIGVSSSIYSQGEYSIALGNSSATDGASRATAIGNATSAKFNNSIAIGSNATTTREGEVNVGAGTSGRGYNSTNYRVIGGVHDGQNAQDAVTVNQVNTTIDAINTALNTNIQHIGA